MQSSKFIMSRMEKGHSLRGMQRVPCPPLTAHCRPTATANTNGMSLPLLQSMIMFAW